MEGGIDPEILTAAIIAGGFLAAILLLIYAIRRARKARQRQIDEAGEDRPAPSGKPKKPALRAEDVEPDESPSAPPDDETVDEGAQDAPPSGKDSGAADPIKVEAGTTISPVGPSLAAAETPAAKPLLVPPVVSEAPKVALPTDKPRPAPSTDKTKTRDTSALSPGLARTRAGRVSRLGQLFAGTRQIDQALVEEIEKVLLAADIGVRTSQKLLEEIRV